MLRASFNLFHGLHNMLHPCPFGIMVSSLQGGLSETSIYCFANLPGRILFYDARLNRLVLENPKIDTRRGTRSFLQQLVLRIGVGIQVESNT